MTLPDVLKNFCSRTTGRALVLRPVSSGAGIKRSDPRVREQRVKICERRNSPMPCDASARRRVSTCRDPYRVPGFFAPFVALPMSRSASFRSARPTTCETPSSHSANCSMERRHRAPRPTTDSRPASKLQSPVSTRRRVRAAQAKPPRPFIRQKQERIHISCT